MRFSLFRLILQQVTALSAAVFISVSAFAGVGNPAAEYHLHPSLFETDQDQLMDLGNTEIAMMLVRANGVTGNLRPHSGSHLKGSATAR